MDRRWLLLIPTAVLIFLVGSSNFNTMTISPATRTPSTTTQTPSSSQTSTTSSQTVHSVPFDQIVEGGPPPDGIPSIDKPNFLLPADATFLRDQDLVLGLSYKGEARAYPLLILVWHEIVNDFVAGTPLAVTFCPLCYSALAFVRVVDGKDVTFGTSGRLYDNNLVMYDRTTRSLWSQMWGQAIYGNLTGKLLQRIPIDLMTWGVWKKLYPNTLVLSKNTGYHRPYGTDPYENQGYYGAPVVIFPLSHKDERLPLKIIVLGLSIDGVNKAYPVDLFRNKAYGLDTFNRTGVLDDKVGKRDVVFFSLGNDSARAFDPMVNGVRLHLSYQNGTFVDRETASVWSFDGVALSGPMKGQSLQRYITLPSFWFSWAAFYPDTLVYGQQ